MLQQKKRPFYINFLISSFAASSATIITNPLEVAKTRLQLQGELGSNSKQYTNPIQTLFKIWKEEGICATQKGLLPQIIYIICTNGIRLSAYPKIQLLLNQKKPGEYILFKNCLSGIFSGIISTFTGSPFFLVNVRIKAQSKANCKSFGFSKDRLKEFLMAQNKLFKKVESEEGSIEDVLRKWFAQLKLLNILKITQALSSAFQLPTFEFAFSHLKNMPIPKSAQVFLSTVISGLMTAIAMNPADIITSKLSNQPVDLVTKRGAIYSGIFDCLIQTVKTEGPYGLVKGLSAQCFRIVPHTILTLMFREQYSKIATSLSF